MEIARNMQQDLWKGVGPLGPGGMTKEVAQSGADRKVQDKSTSRSKELAELLTTSEINARIEHIINDAKERVVLVSPYLKLGQRLQTLIEDKDRMKVEMVVIYGKNELSPTEIEWLSKLSRVRTSFCPNLHAKCYYNEFQGIVTSMNLYDYPR